MNNKHHTPTPFFRGVAEVPTVSMVQGLFPHSTHTQADAEAQADKLAAAADAFELVNGRLVQVRDPMTGLPLPGTS